MSQTIFYPVDLHVHSRYSDGLFSPEELAARAVRAGIRQMALCDHDTLEGIQPMKRAVAARLPPAAFVAVARASQKEIRCTRSFDLYGSQRKGTGGIGGIE